MKRENPFNPGSGAIPPFLAGRDGELASFERSLRFMADGRGENVMLTGLRGTGKTVLLGEFSKMCLQEKFFPIKRLQFAPKYNEPDEFYAALKYDMSAAVANLSVTRKITQKIQSATSHLKPKSVGVPEMFYYEPSYTSDSIPFENHIEEYLAENWPVFKNSGHSGVVFLFDEFHIMHDNAGGKLHVLGDFIGAINELQKNGFPYHLVLAGLPRLMLNVKEARSYSERMFSTMVLENLSNDEAVLAVSKPLEESPCSFDAKLIDMVVDDTGQYPYFLQFYCREIVDRVHKKKISVKDYKTIKPVIIRQLEINFFDSRMDRLTKAEEQLLVSMAKIQTTDMKFKDIMIGSGIKKTSLSSYLDRLEKKGLIYNHKYGAYRFSLPMLRDYIMRRYQQEVRM